MPIMMFRCGRGQREERDADYRRVMIDDVCARTDKAALCIVNGEQIWIPLSAVEDGKVNPGVVQIAAWLVRKESLPEHIGPDRLPTPGERQPAPPPSLGDVVSKAFGRGELLRVEGDKSVVRFYADKSTRTLASRYLEPA